MLRTRFTLMILVCHPHRQIQHSFMVFRNTRYERETMLRRRLKRSGPLSVRPVWNSMCLKVRVHALRHANSSQLIVPFDELDNLQSVAFRPVPVPPGLLGFSVVQVIPPPPATPRLTDNSPRLDTIPLPPCHGASGKSVRRETPILTTLYSPFLTRITASPPDVLNSFRPPSTA